MFQDKQPNDKVIDNRAPIGEPLDLRSDPIRVIEALRAMGDYPPADKPNSEERPGHFPIPGGRYSLDVAIEWLKQDRDPWETEIVYGCRGYNRYVVYGDGHIATIESQLDFRNGLASRAEALIKARELGFWVK